MQKRGLVKEIFCFDPDSCGYKNSEIKSVHLLGEFNEWGRDYSVLDDYALIKDKNNHWVGVFDVKPGREPYKFLIDGDSYYPDMSELYYSTISTCEWSRNAIWYQIFPDRFHKSCDKPGMADWGEKPDYFNSFGGDLKGIEQKIDYLKELYNGDLSDCAIYLNSIYFSTASNHKYWPEDLMKIDPQFGTSEDLKSLMEALHQEGAKIIFDVVFNHTGLNHYAFKDIIKNGPESQYVDWYRGIYFENGQKIEIPILQNSNEAKYTNVEVENDPRETSFDPSKESYLSIWGGKYKFPIENPEKFKNSSLGAIIAEQPYYLLTDINNQPSYNCWFGFFEIPELNTKNPDVKEHLFESARRVLRLGFDGFRLDVPDLLENAHEFWEEFREEMRKELENLGRDKDSLYILGEIWSNDEITNSFLNSNSENRPRRFDAVMNYPIREVILNFLSGEILEPKSDRVQAEDEISISELDEILHKNYANISFNTDKSQFNCFSTHDTRRLRSVLSDFKVYKTALLMQFSLIGAPTIYYGDEIGMKGNEDPDNRRPMKWDVFDNLIAYQEPRKIFGYYQQLISLRQHKQCLRDGVFLTVKVDDENKLYSYARYLEDECAIVIVSRNEPEEDVVVDISNLPFSDIDSWYDPFSGNTYQLSSAKKLHIIQGDFEESNSLILFGQKNNVK